MRPPISPPYGPPSPPYRVVADVDASRIRMDGSADTDVRALTSKRHSVTGGANVVYEYGTQGNHGGTMVYCSCFLCAGHAPRATAYHCRVPLRCTYNVAVAQAGAGRRRRAQAKALWVAVMATKGGNRCMLWLPPAGTIKMLSSVSQLCSIGGDTVTDVERRGADALGEGGARWGSGRPREKTGPRGGGVST